MVDWFGASSALRKWSKGRKWYVWKQIIYHARTISFRRENYSEVDASPMHYTDFVNSPVRVNPPNKLSIPSRVPPKIWSTFGLESVVRSAQTSLESPRWLDLD